MQLKTIYIEQNGRLEVDSLIAQTIKMQNEQVAGEVYIVSNHYDISHLMECNVFQVMKKGDQ